MLTDPGLAADRKTDYCEIRGVLPAPASLLCDAGRFRPLGTDDDSCGVVFPVLLALGDLRFAILGLRDRVRHKIAFAKSKSSCATTVLPPLIPSLTSEPDFCQSVEDFVWVGSRSTAFVRASAVESEVCIANLFSVRNSMPV